jgi:hypothetical protein
LATLPNWIAQIKCKVTVVFTVKFAAAELDTPYEFVTLAAIGRVLKFPDDPDAVINIFLWNPPLPVPDPLAYAPI